MNKNEKFVITINRELGSGGRTIGRILAEKLGVPFYDKALIKTLEEKYNLSTEEIERKKARSRHWWSDFERVVGLGYGMSVNVDPSRVETVTTSQLFQAEKEILEGIAQDKSCVIAGRLAFFVLKSHPNHLSVLIQSSMESRIARVMRKKNISQEEAVKLIDKVDKMREKYVKNFSNTSRYDTRNYDLVIRTDGKTEEEVANHILNFIGER
ncbi:MAG: cytidylate kinase-like family protein [Prevotella sp.]|nr:cytidylate kinase-like family protein [Prevotella sp.]MBR4369057.1 cytidylate kinase-like family protein [Prevotella sp.]MBR7048931.1 cytidylate kinase-like family protein [Prevotella sp.]